MNMEEKEDKKGGFFSNWIVRNVLLAVLFFAVLIFVSSMLLSVLTNHGKTIEVPDFTSMTVNEAKHEASRSKLRVEVIDSIFVRKMERGAIYSQNPKPGSQVKQGRRILLTINAKQLSAYGGSMDAAAGDLEHYRSVGFGALLLCGNAPRARNLQIRPGRQIETGSEINLEVGLNPEDNLTYIPNVKGLKYLRAVDAVHDNSLNIGRIVFDKSVRNYTDSLNASVTRQTPEASGNPILMGSDVTLYLSLDKKDE